MCGIAGFAALDPSRLPPGALDAMLDAMVHRGPDGKGEYREGGVQLGMRRLSVIDLEQGWQPHFSNGRNIVAFQNGEIYNFKQLRRELEAKGYGFLSRSDTEVLAHGFAAWGFDGLLRRLDGMFAVAILDRRNRRLHLARDRFGEKPLFVAQWPGLFAFASTTRSLALLPDFTGAVDPRALDYYLAFHYVFGSRTLFHEIGRVLPGEALEVDLGDLSVSRRFYYELPLGRQAACSPGELAECLEEATASRLVADVPVGVFLSGGLDSSLVAAMAAKHQPGIPTFSMGFTVPERDESAHAAAVARHIGSTHHHFRFDEDCFLDLLPQVARALDEPVGDQATLPVYWLSREARKHLTVVLSGEGADEVFGGYRYYRPFSPVLSWKQRLKLVRRGPSRPDPVSRLIQNAEPVTPSGFPLLTDVAGRRRLMTEDPGVEAPDLDEARFIGRIDEAPDPLGRAAAADLLSWLPDDLLVKFDRMTMAHSLEGRAPFLAPAVVEKGVALAAAKRVHGETLKAKLKKAARRYLPADIVERRKQGFVLPMREWLFTWFRQAGGAAEYCTARPFPGLDGEEMRRVIQEDLDAGLQRERLLFALVLLLEWHREFTASVAAARGNWAVVPTK
ncbi:MAG: asparagine synthase (glutamine-hydrolyzing) [Acidobacteria bacterium]|nr:asparagine synthase (glutamine-hydrolyzing) [Acidobacteriota bacterium]